VRRKLLPEVVVVGVLEQRTAAVVKAHPELLRPRRRRGLPVKRTSVSEPRTPVRADVALEVRLVNVAQPATCIASIIRGV